MRGSEEEEKCIEIETVPEEEEYDSDENTTHDRHRSEKEVDKEEKNSLQSGITHDNLVEELEDVFHDANDEF
jgi:hypothetical protein